MSGEDRTLEAVLASVSVFLAGYVLLLVALFANSALILYVGIGVLLTSYALVRRIDPIIRRSCASSGLVSILLVGLIIACLYWDATLTVKLLILLASPVGYLVLALGSGLSREIGKLTGHVRRTYSKVSDQSSESVGPGGSAKK